MYNLIKLIESNPTQPVRRTMRSARHILRLIAYATAEWLENKDLGSWDELEEYINEGRDLGLTDAEMTREVVKAGR